MEPWSHVACVQLVIPRQLLGILFLEGIFEEFGRTINLHQIIPLPSWTGREDVFDTVLGQKVYAFGALDTKVVMYGPLQIILRLLHSFHILLFLELFQCLRGCVVY